MHVSLPISKETILMGSDTGGEWSSTFKAGNNFSISVNAESKEEADKIIQWSFCRRTGNNANG